MENRCCDTKQVEAFLERTVLEHHQMYHSSGERDHILKASTGAAAGTHANPDASNGDGNHSNAARWKKKIETTTTTKKKKTVNERKLGPPVILQTSPRGVKMNQSMMLTSQRVKTNLKSPPTRSGGQVTDAAREYCRVRDEARARGNAGEASSSSPSSPSARGSTTAPQSIRRRRSRSFSSVEPMKENVLLARPREEEQQQAEAAASACHEACDVERAAGEETFVFCATREEEAQKQKDVLRKRRRTYTNGSSLALHDIKRRELDQIETREEEDGERSGHGGGIEEARSGREEEEEELQRPAAQSEAPGDLEKVRACDVSALVGTILAFALFVLLVANRNFLRQMESGIHARAEEIDLNSTLLMLPAGHFNALGEMLCTGNRTFLRHVARGSSLKGEAATSSSSLLLFPAGSFSFHFFGRFFNQGVKMINLTPKELHDFGLRGLCWCFFGVVSSRFPLFSFGFHSRYFVSFHHVCLRH